MIRILLAAWLFTALSSADAGACPGLRALSQDYGPARHVDPGDVIVRAKLKTPYDEASKPDSILIFEVIESFGYPKIQQWSARWQFPKSAPAKWEFGDAVIVVIHAVLREDGTAAVVIKQNECGPPAILADTPENLRFFGIDVGNVKLR